MKKCENCGKDYANLGYGRHKITCDVFYKNDILRLYKKGKSPNRLAKEYEISADKIKEYLGNNLDDRRRCYIDMETEKKRRKKISNKLKRNPKAGGYRRGAGRGKSGEYKGYWCDSTYELVWVIYHIDHDISFERNKERFPYTYESKTKNYLPDFMKNGILYEIKGYKDELTDLKLKSVNKPIKILYKKDIQYMFDYVKDKYTYDDIYDLYDGYEEIIDNIKKRLHVQGKEEYVNLLITYTYSNINKIYNISKKELKKLTKHFNININEININKRKKRKQKIKEYYCKCGEIVSKKGNRCMRCAKYQERKIKNRPSYEQLLEDLYKTNYTKTAEKYGVSDNCIRKWIKKYEKENGKF